MSEVQDKIKQIIVDELGVDEAEVTENARFIEDLGADSLDLVELVMRFEEEFDIEIPDEDAEKIQSVRDAYAYVEQHKGLFVDRCSDREGSCDGRRSTINQQTYEKTSSSNRTRFGHARRKRRGDVLERPDEGRERGGLHHEVRHGEVLGQVRVRGQRFRPTEFS